MAVASLGKTEIKAGTGPAIKAGQRAVVHGGRFFNTALAAPAIFTP